MLIELAGSDLVTIEYIHPAKASANSGSATQNASAQADGFTKIPLTVSEWLTRDLPEPDLIMGHILSTTTRALIHANTGIGKTNFGMALVTHAGVGMDFLHWRCSRPRRMLFIDGEMSRTLLRDYVRSTVQRLPGDPGWSLFFNKEDIEGFAPLNTKEGQAAIWKLIEEAQRRTDGKLDGICFDNIMALLHGDMKEEDTWRDTLPLVTELTKRLIGQVWLHHTGHDTSRGYGTKTREWRMDTVMHFNEVKRPDTGISFTLSFHKARERRPENFEDFADVDIALVNDKWMGSIATDIKKKIDSDETVKFFEALQAAATHSSVAHMSGRPTASLEEWQAECVNRGLIDLEMKAHSARTLFSRHRLRLISANWIAATTEVAWILP